MSWVTRRIAGFITVVVVSALLAGIATGQGWLSGELSLTTVTGIVILGIAFLASLVVTSHMKRNDESRRAWEQNQQAWEDYYARFYPGYVRRR